MERFNLARNFICTSCKPITSICGLMNRDRGYGHRVDNNTRSNEVLLVVGTFDVNLTSIHAILSSTTRGFNKVLIGTKCRLWRQQAYIEKREQNFAEVGLKSGAGCTKGG